MRTRYFKMVAAVVTFGMLALSAAIYTDAWSQTDKVDPAATQILQKMTAYLGGLKQFSLHTQTTLEDLLESGHRVDFDVSADVIISRPNKLHAERKGDLVDQVFYYDGKSLTLHNPLDKVYATAAAPGTIEQLLDYARESLGLTVPVADLVYRNAFELLIQDVNFAKVVGKSVISGVRCDHLVFSRPGVDFQIWIADSGQRLPYKYVVTDTGTPALVSVTTVMSNWNVASAVPNNQFNFMPPQEAKRIDFMPL